MFCRECGKQLGDDTKYCPFCGTSVLIQQPVSESLEPSCEAEAGKSIENEQPLNEPECLQASLTDESADSAEQTEQTSTSECTDNTVQGCEKSEQHEESTDEEPQAAGSATISPDEEIKESSDAAPDSPLAENSTEPANPGRGAVVLAGENLPAPLKKKPDKRLLIAVGVCLILVVMLLFGVPFIKNNSAYKKGVAYFEEGNYEQAELVLTPLSEDNYRDTKEILKYMQAQKLYNEGKYTDSYAIFRSVDYSDAKQKSEELIEEIYARADADISISYYDGAINKYMAMADFPEAAQRNDELLTSLYTKATDLTSLENYKEAAEIFSLLAQIGYQDSGNWNTYCEAGLMYLDKRYYEAYKLYDQIYSFMDAEEKAEKCRQSAPGSKVLYRNSKYKSSAMSIKVKAPNASYGSYVFIKIYTSSDTLAASLFIRAGKTVKVSLKAGTYKMKVAYGDTWWGTKDAFGDEGDYSILLLGSSSETYKFKKNYIYTITLKASSGGNVPSEGTSRDSF